MLLTLGANTIIVTLNDSKTIDIPEYVLIFVNKDTNKKVACKLGTDLSSYPERYNKFSLTVNTIPNPLLAQVNLKEGDHRYYVYEMVDADSFSFSTVDTLDISTLSGQVEEGIMKYYSEPAEYSNYKNNPSSIKSYV